MNPHRPLLLVGGRVPLRFSAAASISCATCRHVHRGPLINGKANERRLPASTQHRNRQRKGRWGMEGEGHAEHPALVDVGRKGEQAAHAQQPGQSHESTWESKPSGRDCSKGFCSLQNTYFAVLAPSSVKKKNLHRPSSATGIRNIRSRHHHVCHPPR